MTCVIIRNKTSAPTSLFFAVVASIPLFMTLALHSAAAQEIDDKYEIEAFINASLEACRLDALEYCGDVAPGDGRLGQCLRSLGASLSEGCASALDALSTATIVVPEEFSTLYPTLENRELGEPIVNEDGEAQVWGRALPFLGQKVLDLGFELPNPYGVAIIPFSPIFPVTPNRGEIFSASTVVSMILTSDQAYVIGIATKYSFQPMAKVIPREIFSPW